MLARMQNPRRPAFAGPHTAADGDKHAVLFGYGQGGQLQVAKLVAPRRQAQIIKKKADVIEVAGIAQSLEYHFADTPLTGARRRVKAVGLGESLEGLIVQKDSFGFGQARKVRQVSVAQGQTGHGVFIDQPFDPPDVGIAQTVSGKRGDVAPDFSPA